MVLEVGKSDNNVFQVRLCSRLDSYLGQSDKVTKVL